jgi:hypothetical protein
MNFRQYRQSEIVQAAVVVGMDTEISQGVKVADVDGVVTTIVSPGLLANTRPLPGDYLVLHPAGGVELVPVADFDAIWEPVRGALLS